MIKQLNPENIDLGLRQAICDSWSAFTSISEKWTPQNPALGQCAVSACVIQDYYGGSIVRTVATSPGTEPESHYYNILASGEIDVSRQQFPDDTIFSDPHPRRCGFPTTRAYILSNYSTRLRYIGLQSAVASRYSA